MDEVKTDLDKIEKSIGKQILDNNVKLSFFLLI